LPSPARVPVQVTGMLVVPENVHTGSPPFLKCGLEAKAVREIPKIRNSANNRARPYLTGRMVNLLAKFNANTCSQKAQIRTLLVLPTWRHYKQRRFSLITRIQLRSSTTNANSTRQIAQEEVVQNRQRDVYPGMGEISENNTPLSLPQRVY